MVKVRETMTADVRTVRPTASLAEAARAMREEDVGALPIAEGGELVGVVTDRDIVVRALSEDVDPHALYVSDVASRELVTVEPEQDLEDALALMARHQVRRVPVVENRHLVGMLAQADAAIVGDEAEVGDVLEKISRPAIE
jgi:CBS domain-containing protein